MVQELNRNRSCRNHFSRNRCRNLLSLFFFSGKWQGKSPKRQGSFIPTEPLKSLEKKGRTLKKTRNSSQGYKRRNSKTKLGKDRRVIFKVSFCVWVFREHQGVPWEPPHVRVRKWHLFIGRIHSKTRENKCHFSEKPLGTPLEAIEFLFFFAKGVPQEHGKKWHPESDTWTCWRNGAVKTVFQKPRPEPCHPLKNCTEMHRRPFHKRNRQNRKPELLEQRSEIRVPMLQGSPRQC